MQKGMCNGSEKMNGEIVDNHKTIEKYTKLVMKRLYDVDVHVFFCDMPMGVGLLKAIFRDKNLPPYSMKNYETYKKDPKCSITFHSKIFRQYGELPLITWNDIVHEVTHYEEGITSNKKGNLVHSKDFTNLYRKNLKKVEDLHQQFMDEIE